MRTTHYVAAIAVLATGLIMSLAGCSSAGPARRAAHMATSRNQTLELPLAAGIGEGKEMAVLLETPYLKLVTITLRDGTSLPSHRTPTPVTIQVLEGEGVIHVGSRPVSVTKGSLVALMAGEEHDVITKSGTSIVLLVHYLRGSR